MSGHTKGPWVPNTNAYGVWFVNGGDEHDNGRVKYHDLVCGGNNHDTLTEANARLIAAAPELLDVAEMWKDLHSAMIDQGGDLEELPAGLVEEFAKTQAIIMAATDAAIAKAKGTAQ